MQPLTLAEKESAYWLALTAHRLARQDGACAMLGVMQVIMERFYAPEWFDTVPAVAEQLLAAPEVQAGPSTFLHERIMPLQLADLTLRHHVGVGHGLALPGARPLYCIRREAPAPAVARRVEVGAIGGWVFYE